MPEPIQADPKLRLDDEIEAALKDLVGQAERYGTLVGATHPQVGAVKLRQYAQRVDDAKERLRALIKGRLDARYNAGLELGRAGML